MPSQQAIGVFDSGLGGLSVLTELQKKMPHENFLYLGDVARLPYGIKSAAVVTQYVRRCVKFLLDKKVKAIVIACNTASAMALETIRDEVTVPVFGVIEPGVRAAIHAVDPSRANARVLVLATLSTVNSGAYLAGFSAMGFGAKAEQLACPLLVPLAEEGWFDHPITVSIVRTYLERAKHPFDAVLLGCTHYPLLEKSFRHVVGPEIALVHGGQEIARELRQALVRASLANEGGGHGQARFFATDHIAASIPMLGELFSEPVLFDRVDI